jgi:branched-chain amino acid transport system substrate-binding protein
MRFRISGRPARRSLAVLAALTLALSACSSGDNGSDTPGATDPGVDVANKTITFGGWRVASGPVSASDANTRAALAHLSKINDAGGINGWKIKWDPPDAGADPSRALQIAREQVTADNIFAFFDGMGSAQNAAALPYLKSTPIPYFNPATSNPTPEVCTFQANIIPFPPAIASAGSLLAKYAYDTLKARKFFVVYSRDANGQPGADGIKAFVPTMNGASIVGEGSFAATDTDFSGVGRDVATAAPDAVIVFGAVPAAMVKSKKEAMARGSNANWLAMNTFASPATVALDPAAMDGSYFYLPQTPFFQTDDADVKDWMDTVKKYFPDEQSLGGTSQSGYAPVYLLAEAIKRMTDGGKVPSRDGFIKSFQSFGQTGKIGLIAGVNYNDKKYEGINTYWIAQWKNNTWSQVAAPTKVPDYDYCSIK